MKTLLFLTSLLLSVTCFGQLTLDQKAAIAASPVFQARVQQVLMEKSQYWKNSPTPTRADVNVRMQKRKVFSSFLLNDASASESVKIVSGNYWLTTVTNPALDGNGIPTSGAIGDSFDGTYDYFAKVNPGDENNTEIDW
jgi:hypothetical protein